MSSSWIKVHRKIVDWEWYTDSSTVHLFFHLLIKANYKESSYRGMAVERGQVLTGRKKLAAETGISEQKIRTGLERLKETNEITIKSTNKFSVITICNYDTYQGEEEAINQQINQQDNQQITTSKKNKEIKNKNTTTQKQGTLTDIAVKEREQVPYEDIVKAYHEELPSWRKVRILTADRKRALKARCREDSKRMSVDFWRKYFKYAGTKPFLMGANKKGWTSNFDHLIREKTIANMYEGAY